MTDEAPANVRNIEVLNKKVDAVIDHTATQFGKTETSLNLIRDALETRASDLESRCSEHFGLIETRMNATSDVLERVGDRLNEMDKPNAPIPVELYKALVAAQGEIRNADKNVDNEFTNKKYADLASVMNAVRGPLSDHGLAIIQVTATIEEVATVDTNPAAIGIKTTLVHETGETLVDITAMCPPKNDPQGIGSCRTYMRRYAVLAMCAIAGANDDDAEGTTTDPNDYPRITSAEAEKIIYTADELFGERADAAVAKMLHTVFSGLTVVGDIREGEMEVAISALQNSKKLMEKNEKAAKAKEKAAAKAAKEG